MSRPPPGTLLGPEGPGKRSNLSDDGLRTGCDDQRRGRFARTDPRMNHSPRRAGTEQWAEFRPHLENCTVDASIFVAKLIRAHGGCLGTRSRRRT